jgi:hypothetical protein
MGWLLGLVFMTGPTYIVQTMRGGGAAAYDSLPRAMQAKAEAERRVGAQFQIIERTIRERVIA